MASRIFLCLLTAACCCITLLPPPEHGRRRPAGLHQAASGGGGLGGHRLLHQQLPVPVPEPEPRFVPTEVDERRNGVPVMTSKQARPAAAWSVRPAELRAVPAGSDPMHHHGGSPSRRPEQDHRTPSP